MQEHAQTCVEGYCELAHKTIDKLQNVSTLCLDDYLIKPEDLEIVGELSETCSQNVLKRLCVARIGRPDLLWTVNTWSDQSQCGTEHVIFDMHGSSATFITRQDTHSTVTFEIKQKTANWDYSSRKSHGLEISIRWRSVYIGITDVCAKFMGL